MPLVAQHHEPAKYQKRDTVRHDVAEIAVKEGSEQDSAQSDDRSRNHAKLEQASTEEHVHDEHDPEHSERSSQDQSLGLERAHHASAMTR
jgi:hypothetical protein